LGGRSHEDNSKKLFRVVKKRELAIAGLASAAVVEVPGLTEEIAPLLEDEIEYSAGPSRLPDSPISTTATGMSSGKLDATLQILSAADSEQPSHQT
jgi:hypothetical protein